MALRNAGTNTGSRGLRWQIQGRGSRGISVRETVLYHSLNPTPSFQAFGLKATIISRTGPYTYTPKPGSLQQPLKPSDNQFDHGKLVSVKSRQEIFWKYLLPSCCGISTRPHASTWTPCAPGSCRNSPGCGRMPLPRTREHFGFWAQNSLVIQVLW